MKKLVTDPAMSLSDNDKREVCAQHGWVGRRIFQQDRHDLCEAPPDLPEFNDLDEANGVGVEEAEDAVEARGSRSSARRRGIPPKKTLAVRRITQVELAAGRSELQALGGDEPYDRPKTRGDCQWCSVCQLVRDGTPQEVPLSCGHQISEVLFRSRPCVFAACKFSLYLDVSDTGSIILNFPHLEPGQMPADRSCALDLSDRGSMTLEEVAVVTNLTRERIRQVELKALIRRAKPTAIAMGLGAEDAAAIGGSHRVGPSADLEETGVDGGVPSDVSTILTGNGWDS